MMAYRYRSSSASLATLILLKAASTEAFHVVTVPPASAARSSRPRRPQRPLTVAQAAARYGPPMDNASDGAVSGTTKSIPNDTATQEAQQEADFRRLLERVMTVQDPQHVPSLLTKNMELILSLSSENGVRIVENILQETVEEQGEEAAEAVSRGIDLILTFAENFVEEAVGMEDQNKKLLGKIINTVSDKNKTASQREQDLDELLVTEKERFTTAGFLRHLDTECSRIARAPKMTPESMRLLELLRLIQTRVLEEMGSDLGEAARVLGQLIGYESSAERQAVLEAGLTVRGPVFAQELQALTKEALEGFQKVIGGADPGLVECVEQIDDRIRRYLAQQTGP